MLHALRIKLEYLETDFAITETLCSTIAEWLETETVEHTQYPQKFHKAIVAQTTIGWRHVFSGKISTEWLVLQEESNNKTNGEKRASYIWGASVIEVTLLQFIDLWEIRNEEVHGKTIEQQETTRKAKLATEVKRLNAMRDIARPSDACLFIDNEQEYLERSTARTIATFVSSHRRAILDSVQKWSKTSMTRATSILHWLNNSNTATTIEKIHTRQRSRLMMVGRRRRRRRRQQQHGRQTSIAGYFSLHNRLH